MEQRDRRSLARDAEGVVRRLHGVSAARVEVGDDGRIDQVHVLGAADRTAVRAEVQDILHCRARYRDPVDAGMGVEVLVLGGEKSLDDASRDRE